MITKEQFEKFKACLSPEWKALGRLRGYLASEYGKGRVDPLPGSLRWAAEQAGITKKTALRWAKQKQWHPKPGFHWPQGNPLKGRKKVHTRRDRLTGLDELPFAFRERLKRAWWWEETYGQQAERNGRLIDEMEAFVSFGRALDKVFQGLLRHGLCDSSAQGDRGSGFGAGAAAGFAGDRNSRTGAGGLGA